LDKFIPKIPILAIFGAVSPHFKREICEIWHDGVGLGLLPHTTFCKKIYLNLQFWRFYACKLTFLKPTWNNFPRTEFCKSRQRGFVPWQIVTKNRKFHDFDLLKSTFLYVEILHKRTDFGNHQQHKISSKSLKGPASIAFPRK